MDRHSSPPTPPRWRKVAYGGMQPGFDDNHTDELILEQMVMNANVDKQDMINVMQDSFHFTISMHCCSRPLAHVTISLLILHLFLHDYSKSTVTAPGAPQNPTLTSCISLNASVVASVFIASRLPSRLHVFAIMLFSLLVFLFALLVTYCVKKYSFQLYLFFSFTLMVAMSLAFVHKLHWLLFGLLLGLFFFVTVVCPYWLIQIQEYKFKINGPWDEAKLCFDITD